MRIQYGTFRKPRRTGSRGAAGQNSVALADFFWLGIAFSATRTRMAPAVAIAATGFFDLEQ
jgi:hypothetical protein